MSTRILRSHSSQQNDLSVSQASEGNPNRLTAEQIMLSNNLQPFDPPTHLYQGRYRVIGDKSISYANLTFIIGGLDGLCTHVVLIYNQVVFYYFILILNS